MSNAKLYRLVPVGGGPEWLLTLMSATDSLHDGGMATFSVKEPVYRLTTDNGTELMVSMTGHIADLTPAVQVEAVIGEQKGADNYQAGSTFIVRLCRLAPWTGPKPTPNGTSST